MVSVPVKLVFPALQLTDDGMAAKLVGGLGKQKNVKTSDARTMASSFKNDE